jgi:hypothetical protein
MNISTLNHEKAIQDCQTLFDRAPYNLMGGGLPDVASQVLRGDCRSYTLKVPKTSLCGCETLLGLIELVSGKAGVKDAIWEGLGASMNDKASARRNIDYYRLNLVERIGFVDADVALGDQNGQDLDHEIQAAFPELAFSETENEVLVSFHLPNRH